MSVCCFVYQVLDELLLQLYKTARESLSAGGGDENDEEEDRLDDEDGGGGGSDAEDKDKSGKKEDASTTATEINKKADKELALRREKHGCAAAMLYAWLCRRSGAMGRFKSLIYDLLIVNGTALAFGPLTCLIQIWPEALGKGGGHESLIARVIFSYATEALTTQAYLMKKEKEGDREAKEWVANVAYEGLGRALKYEVKETGSMMDGEAESTTGAAEEDKKNKSIIQQEKSLDDLAKGLLDKLAGEEGVNETKRMEMLRCFSIIASARDLQWIDDILLKAYATGEITTPAPIVHLLASLAKDLAIRGALEQRSGEMMRRLLVCFSEMLAAAAADEEEEAGEEGEEKNSGIIEAKQWACRGLGDLPGISVGELKAAVSWIQSVDSSKQVDLPGAALRSVSNKRMSLTRSIHHHSQKTHKGAGVLPSSSFFFCSSSAVGL